MARSGRVTLSRPLAVAAMLGSAACWGGATVMTKGALEGFGPFTLLTIQLIASVSVLWSIVIVSKAPLPEPKRLGAAGSVGVFEPGLAYAVGVPGLALTTAGNATVIAALEPIFILILAWLLMGTAMRRSGVVAVAVSVVGVAMVSSVNVDPAWPQTGVASFGIVGDGLILIGTIFAALYVIASSRLAASMPAVVLTASQQTVGLVFVLALVSGVYAAGWERFPSDVTLELVFLAVASGLVQYALAFWLYIVGLKGIPVSVAGLFLTTTPVFGMLGGAVFLGEVVVSIQVLGAGLVIGGLLWVLSLERQG